MSEKTRQIAFYGTEEYRFRLQREALDRGIKVQVLLEEAVERYLHTESRETVTAKRHSPEIERLITWWNHPPNKRERALRDWLREIIKTRMRAYDDVYLYAMRGNGKRKPAKLAAEKETRVAEGRLREKKSQKKDPNFRSRNAFS